MMSNRSIERQWPQLLGLLFAIAFYASFPTYKAPDTAKDLLTAVISIGAIAVGFLATMKAVLFTIDKKTIISQLKEANLYKDVVDYILWGIVWWSVLSILSAAELIIDVKGYPRIYHLSVAVWIFVASTAIGSYWRVVKTFTKILREN